LALLRGLADCYLVMSRGSRGHTSMTIRQRRKQIKELAQNVCTMLDELESYCGDKEPFALSEEEFAWQQKAKDNARQLTYIDINEKPGA
jgi:hypothetical protein